MKKGSIEFSTKQIVILIVMVVIAAIVIMLGITYSDSVKNMVSSLFQIHVPGAR